MEAAAANRLSVEHARTKADECRALAMHTPNVSHQVMLIHMAETWERIAQTMMDGH